MFRFAERGIGYVSFRNRASVSGLETGRYAKRSEDFARLTFLFFFGTKIFRFLEILSSEKPWESRQSEEKREITKK